MGTMRTQVVKYIRKGDPGAKGEHGAVLRGPQDWSGCANGYAFQAGAPGEDWLDVVMYSNQYYVCKSSHTKTSTNYPGSTTDRNSGLWQLGDAVDLIATKILMAQYALVKNLGVEAIDMRDANGNILFTAKDGNVTCRTGTFENVRVSGTIDATAGKIAGFTISGNGLSNTPFANDAYIIFRNDLRKCFAGMGGNVLPAGSGARAIARFENEDTTDQWQLGRNIAVLFSAKNGRYNHAFIGSGNGNLDGWIGGYKFSKYTLSTANTIYSGYSNLKDNNRWVIRSNVDNSGITLPKLSEVRSALSIGTSTPFCVEFTVLIDLDSSSLDVYGRNNNTDGSDARPWSSPDYPTMTDWNGNFVGSRAVRSGDSQTFLLIYDPSSTSVKGGFSTQYTARIINIQL